MSIGDQASVGIDRPNALPDLAAFWMPFTNNRAFKQQPRLLASAEGMHYRTPGGRTVLDGTAGLWCVNAGHGRARDRRSHRRAGGGAGLRAPPFQLAHPLAFELATALAAMMPAGLDRIFFTNSGSESADTALKIALAWQRARGQGSRQRLVGPCAGATTARELRRPVGGGASAPTATAFPPRSGAWTTWPPPTIPAPAFTRGQPEAGADLWPTSWSGWSPCTAPTASPR